MEVGCGAAMEDPKSQSAQQKCWKWRPSLLTLFWLRNYAWAATGITNTQDVIGTADEDALVVFVVNLFDFIRSMISDWNVLGDNPILLGPPQDSKSVKSKLFESMIAMQKSTALNQSIFGEGIIKTV